MSVEEDVGRLSLRVTAAAVRLAKPSQHTGTITTRKKMEGVCQGCVRIQHETLHTYLLVFGRAMIALHFSSSSGSAGGAGEGVALRFLNSDTTKLLSEVAYMHNMWHTCTTCDTHLLGHFLLMLDGDKIVEHVYGFVVGQCGRG